MAPRSRLLVEDGHGRRHPARHRGRAAHPCPGATALAIPDPRSRRSHAVNLEAIPEGSSLRAKIVQHPGKVIPVDNAESARSHLGFLPRLPRSGVLSAAPRLDVMGPVVYGTTLRADDLRQLLHKAGLDGETIPAQWTAPAS